MTPLAFSGRLELHTQPSFSPKFDPDNLLRCKQIRLVGNRAFVTKMLLLMLAGANAAAFHLGSFRDAELWDQNTSSPPGAKLHALASILIWVGVITCGRFIAYL